MNKAILYLWQGLLFLLIFFTIVKCSRRGGLVSLSPPLSMLPHTLVAMLPNTLVESSSLSQSSLSSSPSEFKSKSPNKSVIWRTLISPSEISSLSQSSLSSSPSGFKSLRLSKILICWVKMWAFSFFFSFFIYTATTTAIIFTISCKIRHLFNNVKINLKFL